MTSGRESDSSTATIAERTKELDAGRCLGLEQDDRLCGWMAAESRRKSNQKNRLQGQTVDNRSLAMYKLIGTCPYRFSVSLFRLPEIGSCEIG
jgi:hypothetical protein